MGAITSIFRFECKEKFSLKEHPRTFCFLCRFSKIGSAEKDIDHTVGQAALLITETVFG